MTVSRSPSWHLKFLHKPTWTPISPPCLLSKFSGHEPAPLWPVSVCYTEKWRTNSMVCLLRSEKSKLKEHWVTSFLRKPLETIFNAKSQTEHIRDAVDCDVRVYTDVKGMLIQNSKGRRWQSKTYAKMHALKYSFIKQKPLYSSNDPEPSKACVWGWGDSSVKEVPECMHEDLSLDPKHPCKSQAWQCSPVTPHWEGRNVVIPGACWLPGPAKLT